MKLKNPVLSLVATLLTVLLTLQPAWAVKIAGEPPPGKAASTSRPAFAEPRGTIDRIDLGSNTIVVAGVAYLFAGASVIVHSSDPAVNGNPLKLRKGERIRFTVKKEAAATRERITEIWVLENKAPAPKAK
jgi:hypothetical protein